MKKEHAWVAVLLLSPTACIAVNERVLRDEQRGGQAQEIGQRDLPDRLRASAELEGQDLVVLLRSDRPCQQKLQATVLRRDRVQREIDPLSIVPLGAELMLGLGAGLAAMWSLNTPSSQFVNGDGGKLFTALSCLGLSGGLLGAFGYHVYYLTEDASTTQRDSIETWGKVRTCRQAPQIDTDVQVDIGAVHLQGTSDDKGRVRLRAPGDMNLHSLLAATASRVRVRVQDPFLDAEITVLKSALMAAPAAADRPDPNSDPTETAIPRSDPQTDDSRAQPSFSQATPESTAPPEFIDAAPSGAQLDAVQDPQTD